MIAVGVASSTITSFSSSAPSPSQRPHHQPSAGAATVFSNAADNGERHAPLNGVLTIAPPIPSNASGKASCAKASNVACKTTGHGQPVAA